MNPLYFQELASPEYIIWVLPLMIWTLFWKGYALWIAAKNHQKWWFWIILVVYTAGILEIVYIFGIMKKRWPEFISIFDRTTEPPQAQ
jgi:hypothetical protein